MKKHQVLIFVFLISVLFLLNKVFLGVSHIDINDTEDMVDHDYISSQKLVDNTWKLIRDNYYDAELNNQSWSRWKEHYHLGFLFRQQLYRCC